MKRDINLFVALLVVSCQVTYGQKQKTEVLTLGTFHFAFYNRDVKKIEKKNQIDILDTKSQKEIENVVKRITLFRPTIIVIERNPELQSKIDSTYQSYLKGAHLLSRDESEQIGFRLAKRFGLKTLYCVNDWGMNYEYIDSILDGKDSTLSNKFWNYFYHHPDTAAMFFNENLFKTKGILADLRNRNDEKSQQKDLGNYLIGVFKYQSADNPFFGADFTTGWWFNRNLRIFRNIQKINAKPTDRVLVIFGAGHMNLLNLFFEASPEYRLLKINDYLK